jgi:predicted ATPase
MLLRGKDFTGLLSAMLKRIKIDRFKSVHDAEIEFGRINLLIGGNGSGKSNILEAIGVLAAALSRGVSDSDFSRKGVRLTPPALMKSAFKELDLPKTLRLEAEFEDGVSYDLGLTARDGSAKLSFFTEMAAYGDQPVFGRSRRGCTVLGHRLKREPDAGRGMWDQTRLSLDFDFDKRIARQFDSLARFAIYAPQTEFLREIKSGTVNDPPVGLHGEGLAQAVETLIFQFESVRREYRKRRVSRSESLSLEYMQLWDAWSLLLLPGWTESVGVNGINAALRSSEVSPKEGKIILFHDRYMREDRRLLSAYDSSEGTLFLLFIAVLLGHREAPKIFALDNVDSALNPRMTRELIERMVAMVKRRADHGVDIGPDQVFMTSHNPTSLDAFDLTDPDQRVFVVFRDEKGRTKVKRLQPRPDMSREDWLRYTNGRKLSQMWIDGGITGALGPSGDSI